IDNVEPNERNLSPALFHEYSLAKIEIADENTGGPPESRYVFHDGKGPITENEFVRRYRFVVGSNELDDADKRKYVGSLFYYGALGVLGAVTVAVGLLPHDRPCEPSDDDTNGDPIPDCRYPDLVNAVINMGPDPTRTT